MSALVLPAIDVSRKPVTQPDFRLSTASTSMVSTTDHWLLATDLSATALARAAHCIFAAQRKEF
ncbi:MAG: hypothetical protein QGH15_17885 [Kiritimatiellia bacterium]|jgi:hypothetical protein|nr:hypothetical protein [Kiritimatiellia bacterium]